MRTLGSVVLLLALALALASIAFVGIAFRDNWAGPACTVGVSLCESPWLLMVPVLTTFAWGLVLLRLDE